MIFISNSQAFVQQTSLPESVKLKLFHYKIHRETSRKGGGGVATEFPT